MTKHGFVMITSSAENHVDVNGYTPRSTAKLNIEIFKIILYLMGPVRRRDLLKPTGTNSGDRSTRQIMCWSRNTTEGTVSRFIKLVPCCEISQDNLKNVDMKSHIPSTIFSRYYSLWLSLVSISAPLTG